MSTGLASTAHLCHVLCRYGYEDLAFALLEQEEVPSWLYQVKQGATSVWEAWDAKRPDGSLEKGLSFNHYAFGSIGDWLYRYVAGLQPEAARPGGLGAREKMTHRGCSEGAEITPHAGKIRSVDSFASAVSIRQWPV